MIGIRRSRCVCSEACHLVSAVEIRCRYPFTVRAACGYDGAPHPSPYIEGDTARMLGFLRRRSGALALGPNPSSTVGRTIGRRQREKQLIVDSPLLPQAGGTARCSYPCHHGRHKLHDGTFLGAVKSTRILLLPSSSSHLVSGAAEKDRNRVGRLCEVDGPHALSSQCEKSTRLAC